MSLFPFKVDPLPFGAAPETCPIAWSTPRQSLIVNVVTLVTSFAASCSSTVSASMVAVVSTLVLLAVIDALTIIPITASSPTDKISIAIKTSTKLKPAALSLLFISGSVPNVDFDFPRLEDGDRSSSYAVGVVRHVTWGVPKHRSAGSVRAGQTTSVKSQSGSRRRSFGFWPQRQRG